jgi:hypothetical protein
MPLLKVRRIDASKYHWSDPQRYIDAKDCPTEPELIKAYCERHKRAACLGGYGYMGCRPQGRRVKEFIRYDLKKECFVRTDGTLVKIDETYCGRKIPSRVWHGKKLLENQIWNRAGLGHPDMIDGDLIIEAKGGVPSLSKARAALAQLMTYQKHEAHFRYGFLFPEIWLHAEDLQNILPLFRTRGLLLIPFSIRPKR